MSDLELLASALSRLFRRERARRFNVYRIQGPSDSFTHLYTAGRIG